MVDRRVGHKCKECTCEHDIHIWDECTKCIVKKKMDDIYERTSGLTRKDLLHDP